MKSRCVRNAGSTSMQDFSGHSQAHTQSESGSKFQNLLRRITRIYGRRVPIVIGVPAGTFAALLLYTWVATPQYAATATLSFDLPRVEKSDFNMAAPVSSPDADMTVDSQVKIIRSSSVLVDVVDRLGLVYDSEFISPASLLDRFKSCLLYTSPSPRD